jgi:nucleoside-diphosphate-sugar epimerase
VLPSDPQILVTGGAGYIGSQVVTELLGSGYRVRVLDQLCYGGEALLPFASSPRFDLQVGDIRDRSKVQESLADISAVVHLAAIVGDPCCARQPQLAREVNRDAAEALCDLAIKGGVKRFIFASTCSNYGKMRDPDGYVDENSELHPVSLYAELKVGFEKYLLSKQNDHFSPVCLRFATAYGLSERMRFDLTVNEFTRNLALGRKLEIFGESFWRPYCHVSDLAHACCTAVKAETESVAGRAFNVGDTQENYQKRTLATLISGQLGGVDHLISYVHKAEDPRDYRVNFSRIQQVLGFRVRKRVPDGITEIIGALRSGIIREPDNPRYCNL